MTFLLPALASLSAGLASAQEPTGPGPVPPLEALVAEALAQNPDVRALQEVLEAARARPEQAKALPDPMVSVLYVNDGWSPSLGERDMTTLGVMGSQALPWPGKRGLRESIAAQDAAFPAERLERQRLAVAAGVRRAFWGLVLAQESLGLLGEQEGVWKEAEAVARARYAVGQGAQQDVLRAQVEITRFEPLRAEQEAGIAAREAELSRLVGREVKRDAVAGVRLALRTEPRDLAALQAQAEATLPELRAGAAGLEREQLAIDLAPATPSPTAVQGGYMNAAASIHVAGGRRGDQPVYRGRLRRGREAEAATRGGPPGGGVRAQIRFRTRERGGPAPRRGADGRDLRRRPHLRRGSPTRPRSPTTRRGGCRSRRSRSARRSTATDRQPAPPRRARAHQPRSPRRAGATSETSGALRAWARSRGLRERERGGASAPRPIRPRSPWGTEGGS
jgi:hypothetical protein